MKNLFAKIDKNVQGHYINISICVCNNKTEEVIDKDFTQLDIFKGITGARQWIREEFMGVRFRKREIKINVIN